MHKGAIIHFADWTSMNLIQYLCPTGMWKRQGEYTINEKNDATVILSDLDCLCWTKEGVGNSSRALRG